MLVKLTDLKVGDTVKILGFNPGPVGYQRTLMALGLVPETEFSVLRIAPLGDPLEIWVQRSSLCIRKQEGAILQLERIGTSL